MQAGGDRDPATHVQPGRDPGSGPKPESWPVQVWGDGGADSVPFEVAPSPMKLADDISEHTPTS
jgi:hypothetical protein